MKITVYSTETCAYCRMLEKWLNEKKLPFTEKRVDQDLEAAREMIAMSGQRGVPFTTIEDENGEIRAVLGFDVGALKQALGSA